MLKRTHAVALGLAIACLCAVLPAGSAFGHIGKDIKHVTHDITHTVDHVVKDAWKLEKEAISAVCKHLSAIENVISTIAKCGTAYLAAGTSYDADLRCGCAVAHDAIKLTKSKSKTSSLVGKFCSMSHSGAGSSATCAKGLKSNFKNVAANLAGSKQTFVRHLAMHTAVLAAAGHGHSPSAHPVVKPKPRPGFYNNNKTTTDGKNENLNQFLHNHAYQLGMSGLPATGVGMSLGRRRLRYAARPQTSSVISCIQSIASIGAKKIFNCH